MAETRDPRALREELRHVFWLGGGGFLARTSDPRRALQNVLEREGRFTELLHEEAGRLDLPSIRVEPGMGVEDLAARVIRSLRL